MVILLSLLLVFIGVEVVKDYGEYKSEADSAASLKARVSELKDENAGIENDIDYYSNPHNLEKELKSKFNYKSAGEKMLIVVPDQ